jgi:hypothetical protein
MAALLFFSESIRLSHRLVTTATEAVRPKTLGFADSGGLVFVDEFAEQIATA